MRSAREIVLGLGCSIGMVATSFMVACAPEHAAPENSRDDEFLETYSLRDNDPRHTLIVLKYGGKKHVFLLHTTKYQNYGCSESMVKVGEYDLGE